VFSNDVRISRTSFGFNRLRAVASLPPPPPRPGARRPRQARRRGLSADAIVEAALEVVDAEGLDALTMRRVADELGAGGASLYAHVDSKEALVDLVVDRAIGELELPWPPDPANWQEQVKDCVRRMHAVLASHRDLARATIARIPVGPNALEQTERMLGILRAGGLPDQVVAYAADLLPLYATVTAY
jgi:AcrR family transcriptional regulator